MVKRSGREGVKRSKAAQEKAVRPSRGSVTKQSDFLATEHAKAPRDARIVRFATAPKQVRIISGAWKRTPLPVTEALGLRPTPDRVRETLFNWIDHLVTDLGAVRGLDLFAGTGALGFELASRGARHVTLIESNRRLVDQLWQTKRRLDADQVDILADDALAAATRWPDASFELIFIDPPYGSALIGDALRLAARLVTRDGLIYAEDGAPILDALLAKHGLEVVRAGHAGRVFFNLLRPQTA